MVESLIPEVPTRTQEISTGQPIPPAGLVKESTFVKTRSSLVRTDEHQSPI